MLVFPPWLAVYLFSFWGSCPVLYLFCPLFSVSISRNPIILDIILNNFCLYHILFKFFSVFSFAFKHVQIFYLRAGGSKALFIFCNYILCDFSVCVCHALSCWKAFAGAMLCTCNALPPDIRVDCCIQTSTQICPPERVLPIPSYVSMSLFCLTL